MSHSGPQNNFETQICIAQQNEQTTKQELKNEIKDLPLQLGAESVEKHLYSKALDELKQNIAHETETIEDVHIVNMENKYIAVRTRKGKKY